MPTSIRLRTLLTASLVTMLAVLVPSSISAHAHLERSEPAADARLSVSPTAIRLWFSEAPELALSTVALLDSVGSPVTLGPVERGADGPRSVRVSVRGALAAGLYRVRWRVAAADGHPSSGAFVFRVLSAAAPPAAESSVPSIGRPPVSAATVHAAAEADALAPAYVVVRALLFIAMLAVIGAIAFRFAVLSPGNALEPLVRAGLSSSIAARAAFASVLLIVLLLAKLVLQARLVASYSAALTGMERVAIDSRWGAAWDTQLAGAVLALAGFVVARRMRAGWSIAAAGAAAIAIGASFSGHAAASEHLPVLGLITDALHVVGAAGWLGTLLWLVASLPAVSTRDRGVATMVNAFSPVALAFAALVTITGVVSAWLRLGALPFLWSSSYGQVLLVKLALLSGVALVGLYNWRRMRPALHTDTVEPRFFRSATTELALGAAVIIVTAVLVATPTP
ncbi:MAG: copper resistance CopC/CopD family protein [Gemmatimonadaceae bacterium]